MQLGLGKDGEAGVPAVRGMKANEECGRKWKAKAFWMLKFGRRSLSRTYVDRNEEHMIGLVFRTGRKNRCVLSGKLT